MGAVTRLDPNTTQNLASQPGASPGEPVLDQIFQAFPPVSGLLVNHCIGVMGCLTAF